MKKIFISALMIISCVFASVISANAAATKEQYIKAVSELEFKLLDTLSRIKINDEQFYSEIVTYDEEAVKKCAADLTAALTDNFPADTNTLKSDLGDVNGPFCLILATETLSYKIGDIVKFTEDLQTILGGNNEAAKKYSEYCLQASVYRLAFYGKNYISIEPKVVASETGDTENSETTEEPDKEKKPMNPNIIIFSLLGLILIVGVINLLPTISAKNKIEDMENDLRSLTKAPKQSSGNGSMDLDRLKFAIQDANRSFVNEIKTFISAGSSQQQVNTPQPRPQPTPQPDPRIQIEAMPILERYNYIANNNLDFKSYGFEPCKIDSKNGYFTIEQASATIYYYCAQDPADRGSFLVFPSKNIQDPNMASFYGALFDYSGAGGGAVMLLKPTKMVAGGMANMYSIMDRGKIGR